MIVSLCSGYGGLDRAVAAAFRLPLALHAEPFKVRLRKDGPMVANPVIEVLERRFPGVPNIGDIKEAAWDAWRNVCRVLCAGFPCQPVSAAGRQLAEDDERWLWPSVHRAILALDPEWVVLENVANIVSIKGGAVWRLIIEHLQAAGYGVAWGIFGACLVGACHHRHRMFLVARKGAAGALRWPGKACSAHRGAILPTPTARDWRGVGPADYTRNSQLLPATVVMLPTPAASPYGSNQGGAAGRVGPVRHSLDQLARLEPLPTITAKDATSGLGHSSSSDGMPNLRTVLALLPTPRATDGTNGRPGQRGSSDDLAMPSAVQPQHWGRFAGAVARHAAWRGEPPAPTEVGPKGGVRMAAPFPEWMMGLTAGYVTDVLGRNDALRAIGNGVMPQQGYYAINELLALLA